jgi:hypothetical protein
MSKLTRNSVVLFLILVLSAPALTVRHVHRIEAGGPAGHQHTLPGQALTEVPATYHETHIITLLSGDSFSPSVLGDIVLPIQKFIAAILHLPTLQGTSTRTVVAATDMGPHSQPSGDKCVLFCSFLI